METIAIIAAIAAGTVVLGILLSQQSRRQTVELMARTEVALSQALGANHAEALTQLSTMNQGGLASIANLTSDATAQMTKVAGQLDVATRQNASFLQIFANPHARGSWGEYLVADLLRTAGMVEHINFERQQTMESGRRPDYTFLLPNGQRLNLDSKFPLEQYRKAQETDDPDVRRAAEDAFIRAVKLHIKEVATREYINPEGGTLDFALLFIPSESVYAFIHEREPGLLQAALGQKVVLCSPVNLFGVLTVVRQTMETADLQNRSRQILDDLLAIRKQWHAFTDQMDKLGGKIDSTRSVFDELTRTRTRALDRAFDRLDSHADDSDESARSALTPPPLRAIG